MTGLVQGTACARCGHPEWNHVAWGCAQCERDRCTTYVAHNLCDTHDCESPSCFVAHWPGQTRRFCISCTIRAQRVADAMGFRLELVAIALLALLAAVGCSLDSSPSGARVPRANHVEHVASDSGRAHVGDAAALGGIAADSGPGDKVDDGGAALPPVVALDGGDAGELELLDGGDAGELELLDGGDAGELELLDAAGGDPFPALDAGRDCDALCRKSGAPGGEPCTASELPGQVLCCCASAP